VQAKALTKASPIQMHIYARQLQGEKRQDEAFAIFRANFKKYPDQWFVHSGMARVYTAQGDYDNAVKEMKAAMAGAPDQNKPFVEGLVKKLENKEDINQ
jgi:tetratricopeptide (TPR) repeat protein